MGLTFLRSADGEWKRVGLFLWGLHLDVHGVLAVHIQSVSQHCALPASQSHTIGKQRPTVTGYNSLDLSCLQTQTHTHFECGLWVIKWSRTHMLKHVETFHTQILARLMFCHVPEDAHLKTSKTHTINLPVFLCLNVFHHSRRFLDWFFYFNKILVLNAH